MRILRILLGYFSWYNKSIIYVYIHCKKQERYYIAAVKRLIYINLHYRLKKQSRYERLIFLLLLLYKLNNVFCFQGNI
jgi:hypothetical protein